MSYPRKLSVVQMNRLQEKLRRRRALLDELRGYSMKKLAGEFGLHPDSIRKLDAAMFGFHDREPQVLNRTTLRAA